MTSFVSRGLSIIVICLTVLKFLVLGQNCAPGNNIKLLPQVKLINNTIVLHSTEGFHNGNFLTIYYNTRGLAKLLGMCFHMTIRPEKLLLDQKWLLHLPTDYCPMANANDTISDAISRLVAAGNILNYACSDCAQIWTYPHECHGFYIYMRDEMRTEVKSALIEYFKSMNTSMPSFQSDTSVIYIRCKEGDSIITHPVLGPTGFSHYNLAAKLSKTVIIVMPPAPISSICLDIREGLSRYMTKINKNLIVTIQSKTPTEDFATLVFAPRLFGDVSTFALSASLANSNDVYLPKLFPKQITFPTDKFIWTESQVLYPSVAKNNLQLSCSDCKSFTNADKKMILEWLSKN